MAKYIYTVHFTTEEEMEESAKGTVTIVRNAIEKAHGKDVFITFGKIAENQKTDWEDDK